MPPVSDNRIHCPATQPLGHFEVVVLFTSTKDALAALTKAIELGGELGVRITVLVPYIVPYPLPLVEPSVSFDFLRRTFENIIHERAPETRVVVGLCRDREQYLKQALRPGSTVVLRVGNRWLPTGSRYLAKRLNAMGHHVIPI